MSKQEVVEWPLTNEGNAAVLGSRWKSAVLEPGSDPAQRRCCYRSASLCPGPSAPRLDRDQRWIVI